MVTSGPWARCECSRQQPTRNGVAGGNDVVAHGRAHPIHASPRDRQTNLKDAYQIALCNQDIGPFILTKFPRPPGAAPNPANGPTSASDPTGGSTIFKTLEKLGLKLERTKGPVEIFVVDHLEKSPTEKLTTDD